MLGGARRLDRTATSRAQLDPSARVPHLEGDPADFPLRGPAAPLSTMGAFTDGRFCLTVPIGDVHNPAIAINSPAPMLVRLAPVHLLTRSSVKRAGPLSPEESFCAPRSRADGFFSDSG